MNRLGPLDWAVLALVALIAAAAPDVLNISAPKGATVVNRATFVSGNTAGQEVSLPHAIYPRRGNPQSVRYLVDIDLQTAPDEPRYMLIPLLNRRITLESADGAFYDSGFDTLWAGPTVSTTKLVRLPRRMLATGPNRLTLTVFTDRFIVPFYLSPLYVGTDAQLASAFKWRTFLDQMKTASLAAQVLLAAGVLLAFFLRKGGMLIPWLAALETVAVAVGIGVSTGFTPAMREVLPYSVALIPACGLLAVAVALALLGEPPPRFLRRLIVGVTAVTLVCAVIFTPLSMTIAAIAAVLFFCAGTLAATGVICWGALRRGNIDARFMLGPGLLVAWLTARDAYVVATLPDHPFNSLSSYAALVYIAALIAVLMRRMGSAFSQLDRSNETLASKLAAREAELAVLARQEQVVASHRVREQERQRLTHDLHDGLSGHLASIIALSERAESKPIESAAREALNDLRLVIYSLDLGDSELPLALANFRERLIPQLHRLGVELDWSMANLPEVTGVTPGNALTVLRILQEAITNALHHGPARRIAIRGGASTDGLAAIAIENDGQPFVASNGGRGLANMRRRAEQLHATFRIAALQRGTEITLVLPLRLTDVDA